MEEDTQKLTELRRLRHALKAMSKSVSKSLMTSTFEGTGDLVVRNYQRLHEKASQMFPDDYFIETFMLDTDLENLGDHQKLTQVQFVLNQLLTYVDNLIRDEMPNSPDIEELRTMGTDLRDQIIRMTKSTLKSALANIDFGDTPEPPDPPEPPSAPGGRRKIKVRIHTDFDDDDDYADDFDDDASAPNDNLV